MDRETLSSTPSFRRSSNELEENSGRTASLVELPALDSLHDDDEEFEFAVFSGDTFDGLEPLTAEEIFSNGQIRPVYPLFNRALVLDDVEGPVADAAGEAEKAVRVPFRQLMMDDRAPPSTSSSMASSESDELEGIQAESYCVWAPGSVPPSPDHLRKRSHSTGDSSSRGWRLRDLVVGRSHSDGRKNVVFLAAAAHGAGGTERTKQSTEGALAAAEEKKKVKGRVAEMDIVTAHRLYYGKGGAAAGERRRSFLPYRKDLVGFHPF